MSENIKEATVSMPSPEKETPKPIHQNGKGDTPRPTKGDTYRCNFDEIFRKTKAVEQT